MGEQTLSERDICSKYITPALQSAGWDLQTQIFEERTLTDGRIIFRGKMVARGKQKRADYVLFLKPNIPVAVIEAKDNKHSISDGMQQALEYAEMLRVPFAFSSNGDGFVFHDRTGGSSQIETEISLNEFPCPDDLKARFKAWKGLSDQQSKIALHDYHDTGKTPRYYQMNAVNASVEAIAQGRDRLLLVMATGTGKTFTAFQIIWRLWKSGAKKRVLFLADRNVLIDQTMVNDFRPFIGSMAKLSTKSKTIEKADGSTEDLTLAIDKKRRITAACLARLTAPDTDPQDFPTHARFALQTLPALTTRPDQIKTLRQTILNLAVRGKLVEQDPADEPAAHAVIAADAERDQWVSEGRTRKTKRSERVSNAEMAFEIPETWCWVRLGDLVLHSDAGWSPRTESFERIGSEWGVLKVSAVSWEVFDPNANKQVLPGTEPRLQAQVRQGDFLISRANTAELVARAVLVNERPVNLMMSDKIVRLCLSKHCSHRFIWMANSRPEYARSYYAENATGVSPSMKNVSRRVILDLPIPLPPLAEQHRIVAKVDALMALCDRLEAALTTADTTRTRLLDALLHEALEPTLDKEEAA